MPICAIARRARREWTRSLDKRVVTGRVPEGDLPGAKVLNPLALHLEVAC